MSNQENIDMTKYGEPDKHADDGVNNERGVLTEAERAEYDYLNSTLDQINSYLDNLEEQNTTLHSQLRELLESSRQARIEMQQQALNEDNKASEQKS